MTKETQALEIMVTLGFFLDVPSVTLTAYRLNLEANMG